jgi:glycosyltransferase involved in cell wall biosynthesis
VQRSSPAAAASGPFVSVVTPVYNGGRYLAECIESVLAQTHENWEYVLVDNCSTDDTPEIVKRYAGRDARLRVVTNEQLLPMLQNWNRTVREISAASAYCKVLHADDMMAPDCLERMVAVAEAHPSVGIVSSYRLSGTEVDLDGAVPWGVEVLSGREICRLALLEGRYVFGSPSSLLLRSDLIRERPSFYNEENLHADLEVCFDILRTADLGFVHQVLTYTRRHREAVTWEAGRLNTYIGAWLRVMLLYGPRYLTPDERERRLGWWLRRYGVFLGKAVVQGKFRERKFREVHGETISMLRTSLSVGDLARACLTDPVPRRPSLNHGHTSATAVDEQHSTTAGR